MHTEIGHYQCCSLWCCGAVYDNSSVWSCWQFSLLSHFYLCSHISFKKQISDYELSWMCTWNESTNSLLSSSERTISQCSKYKCCMIPQPYWTWKTHSYSLALCTNDTWPSMEWSGNCNERLIRKRLYFHTLLGLYMYTLNYKTTVNLPMPLNNFSDHECWNWYIKMTRQAAPKLSVVSCSSDCSSMHYSHGNVMWTIHYYILCINITIHWH